MIIVIASAALFVLSGLAALFLNRFPKLSNYVGSTGAVIASLCGIASLIYIFANNSYADFSIPWQAPFASFSLAIDPLSLLFLFPIYVLALLAAMYGAGYLSHYYGVKNIGNSWLLFNILITSMIFVVTARNSLLFLFSWEIMTLSSFFLVLFEGEKEESHKAAFLYLVLAHIGTFFLLIMFILIGNISGSFDFDKVRIISSGIIPSVIFILAVIGFGAKAGFIPIHIWLPEAHPAAPSHVSAIMSGVMIKTGIYGIIRILTFLGTPPLWYGYLIIAIGIVSGILGVLFAMAQHDIKRLLAYHSIENIGIIAMGIGLGVLGMGLNNPILASLGFAGGLLHVINHAFFKGLLFLGSGAIWRETGTREIDVLGGLIKKMPVTAFCFLIGAVAISGLPPLNGFISEFLVYFASFKSIFGDRATVFVSLASIASLALIGSLAAACFSKAFGIIFLGEPRGAHSAKAREPGILMLAPMVILAALCVLIGLSGPYIVGIFGKAISDVTKIPMDLINTSLAVTIGPLSHIVAVVLILYLGILLLALFRSALLKKRDVKKVVTWDCGYDSPGPSMQYTASSFIQPIVDFFRGVLLTHKTPPNINKYFPGEAAFKTETSDVFKDKIFSPALYIARRIARGFTFFQQGRLQFYVLYILFTLVILLILKI